MSLLRTAAVVAALSFTYGVHAEDAKLNDAQITHVVKTVNDGEIKLAELALKTTKNVDVKNYATMMVDDHKAMNSQEAQIISANSLKSTNNPTSRSLTKENAEHMAHLKKMKGAEFDSAYITMMAEGHEKVSGLFKDTLIPSASNESLKTFLQEGVTKVDAHQQKAASLAETLKSASGKM